MQSCIKYLLYLELFFSDNTNTDNEGHLPEPWLINETFAYCWV